MTGEILVSDLNEGMEMNERMQEKILELKQISKAFPGVKALDNVDLTLYKGEVLALIGENGAGKSTLIKIISGAYKQDSGHILFKGEEMKDYSPAEAIQRGISIIYQELNDLPQLSVAANIFTGNLPKKGNFIDYKRLKQETKDALEMVGLSDLHPFEIVGDLKVAQKQLIEIARSFVRKAEIIIMDEPTATLTNAEIDVLYRIINNFKAKGGSVIIITHKLEEVFEIADRAMVLRDGRNAGEWAIADVTKDKLVQAMVGRDLNRDHKIASREFGNVALKVKNLSTDYIKNISFELHEGEILGLYGLVGSGCDILTRCIYGAEKYNSGTVTLPGSDKEYTHITPSKSLEAGVAFVPSERKTEGLLLDQSVRINTTLASINQFVNHMVISSKHEKECTSEWVDTLSLKTPSIETEVDSLSGGNQQKVVFAKVMNTNPKVLILNEPTRGIDVGAKAEIYRIIEDFCKKGVAILLVSSEMPETMLLSDRILTLSEGTVTGEFIRDAYTQYDILHAVIGGGKNETI